MRPVCLDLTRSLSRVGVGQATGIDRVERAYLRYFLNNSDFELTGLARVPGRFLIFDSAGVAGLAAHLSGAESWRSAGLQGVFLRRDPLVVGALRTAAKLAKASCRKPNGLSRHMPPGVIYLNVGHSNLSGGVLSAIGTDASSTTQVLLHDTIPLDFPEYQRAGIPQKFRQKLMAATRHADRIVTPSQAVADDLQRHFPDLPTDHASVAPLGIDRPDRRQDILPKNLPKDKPYFVVVGTIEPRKNHRLLLDIWEGGMGDHASLVIIGRRGWRNEALFDRLDQSLLKDRQIFEYADMGDAQLSSLVTRACGLLQPSVAEGFGLPPHEAAMSGTPVICAPLPVYGETLGDAAIYVDLDDTGRWQAEIIGLLERQPRITGYVPPDWGTHFKLALGPNP